MDAIPADAIAAGEGFGAQVWWLVLPGMNWRARSSWPDKEVTNAICTVACVMRLIEVTGQQDRLRKLSEDTRLLREWLNEAETDGDAFLRRYTLCLLVNIATSRHTLRDLRELAKTLHQRP